MSEKKEFDLAALLKDVSDSDTGREQIEYIALDLIDGDANNFYRLNDLEDLAANISMFGLQQPIRLRPNPDAEGRYIIVSGHRRRAAIKLLAEESPEKWKEIGCIVNRMPMSPSLQQLQLIYANSNTRALTSSEISEQAVQVERLLYQLKEEGYEFPGRMRDHVAKAVNASTTKLARLKVIREKLAFCWKPAFKDSSLGESVAYALAQMPSAWQELIYDNYGTKPKQLYEETVKVCHERFKKIAKAKCGDHGDIVCSHQMEMMKKSCKDRWTDPCGAGCCLKCNNLRTCKSACSRASGKQAQLKAAAKEESLQRKTAQEETDRPKIELLQTMWSRFGYARAQAGKTMEETYKVAKIHSSASDAENIESGTKKITAETSPPYGTNFYLWELKRLIAVADLFGCSIDYLLGRTEDLRPAGKWQSGNPWNLGQYAVLIRWASGCKVSVEKMEWNGENWCQFGEAVEIFNDSEIFGWMELPEEVQTDGA